MESKNKIDNEDLDTISGGALSGQYGSKSFSISSADRGDSFTISYGGEIKTFTGSQLESALQQSDPSGSKMQANALFSTAKSSSVVPKDNPKQLAIIGGALDKLFR